MGYNTSEEAIRFHIRYWIKDREMFPGDEGQIISRKEYDRSGYIIGNSPLLSPLDYVSGQTIYFWPSCEYIGHIGLVFLRGEEKKGKSDIEIMAITPEEISTLAGCLALPCDPEFVFSVDRLGTHHFRSWDELHAYGREEE